MNTELICHCCGATEFEQSRILWRELIDAWELSEEESEYINRQQGLHCTTCGSNLRSISLAKALLEHYQIAGTLLEAVDTSEFLQQIAILEVNEAGTLNQYFRKLPGHRLATYPEYDLQNLEAIANDTLDAVVHSDTLEHVPDSLAALTETWRVLKPGGVLAYTVPIVVNRPTRLRSGLPASYHGAPGHETEDLLVRTEYGNDFWKELMLAGFRGVRLHCLEYPASIAITATK